MKEVECSNSQIEVMSQLKHPWKRTTHKEINLKKNLLEEPHMNLCPKLENCVLKKWPSQKV